MKKDFGLVVLQMILVPDLAGPFVAHHARPDRCPWRADLAEELAVRR